MIIKIEHIFHKFHLLVRGKFIWDIFMTEQIKVSCFGGVQQTDSADFSRQIICKLTTVMGFQPVWNALFEAEVVEG